MLGATQKQKQTEPPAAVVAVLHVRSRHPITELDFCLQA